MKPGVEPLSRGQKVGRAALWGFLAAVSVFLGWLWVEGAKTQWWG